MKNYFKLLAFHCSVSELIVTSAIWNGKLLNSYTNNLCGIIEIAFASDLLRTRGICKNLSAIVHLVNITRFLKLTQTWLKPNQNVMISKQFEADLWKAYHSPLFLRSNWSSFWERARQKLMWYVQIYSLYRHLA